MIVEIIPDTGVLGEPLLLRASLVIVRLDDGTPVLVTGKGSRRMSPGQPVAAAGDYGMEGACRASHALDADFNQTLAALGVHEQVICDKLVLPAPPPGARLIRGGEPKWPMTFHNRTPRSNPPTSGTTLPGKASP